MSFLRVTNSFIDILQIKGGVFSWVIYTIKP
nr:MAG TPA: hypothetical protein [Caudoviricetes sp.]